MVANVVRAPTGEGRVEANSAPKIPSLNLKGHLEAEEGDGIRTERKGLEKPPNKFLEMVLQVSLAIPETKES